LRLDMLVHLKELSLAKVFLFSSLLWAGTREVSYFSTAITLTCFGDLALDHVEVHCSYCISTGEFLGVHLFFSMVCVL
jgi:hypothetical protein